MSFDVSPPRPVNDYGTAGEPAYSTTNPPPATSNPPSATQTPASIAAAPSPDAQQDPDFLSASQAAQTAQAAVQSAQQRYDQLLKDFQAAQTAAQDPSNINAAEQLRSATAAFDTAQRDLANANTAAANAQAKMVSSAEMAASRAKDPDLKNYYTAHAEQARAQGDLANAQSAALAAKTPAEVAQANAATAEATARAQSLGILTPAQAAQANQQANLYSAQATQISALTPGLAREQAAKATTAEAAAGIAPQQAQATLDKAQADADKARADVAETRRRIAGMPTEQQAQAAIDLGLQDKEADLQAKQLQLQQAQQLMPLAVSQAGANVQATQAGTAATLAGIGQKTLGPLYGIGDQISRYRDLIASGQLNPQDADTALNSYLNQQVTGATPYQIGQEQNRYQEAIRQQDIGLSENRLDAANQLVGNTLNQFGQLAASAGPGFGKQMASGFQAALGLGQQFFGQMGGLATPPAAPSALSQAPVVHINIGGGQPTSAPQPTTPQLPAAPPPLPAAPAPAPVAAAPAGGDFLSQFRANQDADVAQQQAQAQVQAAGVPAMQGGGVVTRPTYALIGEAGPEAVVPLGQPSMFAGMPAMPAAPLPAWHAHLARWQNELNAGMVQLPGQPAPRMG